jgi:hypothetical protein
VGGVAIRIPKQNKKDMRELLPFSIHDVLAHAPQEFDLSLLQSDELLQLQKKNTNADI